jgi:SAM-dependent methyltransferase
MLQWRTVGALDKGRNIVALVGHERNSIASVLEVGSGTGAVLEQLAQQKVGTQWTGIEIGTERSQQDSRCVQIHGYDGRTIPYPDRSFDLVYATHVLEHVTDERGFLAEMRRVARKWIYLEVPCELHLRTSHQALQRTLDIGHINPYTPESFALRLETSGLTVRKLQVFDHSYDVHRFASPAWKAAVKTVMRGALLGLNQSFACKIFSYHCGALCEPGALLET